MSSFNIPDKCSFADLAAMVGRTPPHLRYDLQDPKCPQPRSLGRWGGTNVYDEQEGREWAKAFLHYKSPEQTAARAAAKRAEAEARQRAEQQAEAERLRINRVIGDSAQQAFEAEAVEVGRMNTSSDYRL
ncbi:MAG: hypothetical protein JSS14_02370 [Proteobacteria bacterium]|nr:hypothetical protein [Pseudomonadota bacterium]